MNKTPRAKRTTKMIFTLSGPRKNDAANAFKESQKRQRWKFIIS